MFFSLGVALTFSLYPAVICGNKRVKPSALWELTAGHLPNKYHYPSVHSFVKPAKCPSQEHLPEFLHVPPKQPTKMHTVPRVMFVGCNNTVVVNVNGRRLFESDRQRRVRVLGC